MGDEVRRTQRGNNNAYCQDNETSWFDWTLVAKHSDVHRFVTLLNAHRLLRDAEPAQEGLSLNQVLRRANKAWHGVKLGQPDLERFFAQPGAERGGSKREGVVSFYLECLLGGARIRAAASGQR